MIKKLCNHQTWLEYWKKSQALLNTEAQSNKFYWNIFSHSHHVRINQSQQLISNKNLIICICMKFVYHSNQQNTEYNEKKLFNVVFNENLLRSVLHWWKAVALQSSEHRKISLMYDLVRTYPCLESGLAKML